ncbi:MAG: VanZ family protein, partial [Lachnospiraceae bacterium]|nr:VanZ family protein [Lachnospiraceae bacterium]
MLLMKMVLGKVRLKLLINAWTLGTFCALVDETIQLFSGRGPMVQDVWLDSAGCFCGVLVMMCGIMIVGKKKKRSFADAQDDR